MIRLACNYCDDTGDVHSADGEWRGRCTCPAGGDVANPWHQTDPTRNTWPEAVQDDTRVDVRFADGEQVLDMTAGGWMWGDALHKTITHWRFHK